MLSLSADIKKVIIVMEKFLPLEHIEKLRTLITTAQNIVLTCHVSPDGDAIGAMLAMKNFLERKGKQVLAVVPNIYPDFLKWLPGACDICIYEKNEEVLLPKLTCADLFFFLDFNGLNRMSTLAEPVMENTNAVRVLVDHHLNPELNSCHLMFSYAEMSSTCELLYHLLVELEGEDNLTHDEAVCIYTGMMTDTGGFTYNSNRSSVYYIIAKLLEKGIDKDKIYRNVFYDYSADRFRLLGFMLYVKMDILPEYNAVLLSLTREEQKRFSHKKGDTEGFVNMPLQIRGTRLSIFLRENTEQDNIRVSLRSVDDFPCNQMAAEFFNGGGHLNASGGQLECSLDEALEIARKAVRKYAPLLRGNKIS